MAEVDPSEVALLRLVAQRLAGPGEPDAAAAVRWLLAAQAQDLRGALLSTALRSPADGASSEAPDDPAAARPASGPAGARLDGARLDGARLDGARSAPDLGGVRAALASGALVRSWPLRSTLHLVAAEDLGWLLAISTERQLRGAASRRAGLGIDEALVERARGVVVDALAGGRRLAREEVLALWEEAGVLGDGPDGGDGGGDGGGTSSGTGRVPQRGYHLLWTLSQTGITCWGPLLPDRAGAGTSDEQALVLLDEWVPAPRRLEREEALGELARRYLASHGPASLADLVRWSGLTVREARAGLALARPHLEALVCDGTEMLLDPATPERLARCRDDARRTLLLPGFDEMVLGYADRSATVPAEHAAAVVPGGNGVFLGTVVTGGRAVATWRRTGRRTGPPVVATPFDGGDDGLAPAVAAEVARLGAALPA
ncbi:winged helix DNA-binding domain-containing protein [uncultured Pseudokineococcus sp.]|uniref:winged helix DNA-binding domain-containing protein n=1 Tax=uncultured Pseudokineococcus sp. TaxID=1642928 RepID=UPI00260DC382|nr:winged helix DNA-binding domain-containing protein [uncultured Pseudokineococcus sp.]